MKGSKLSNDALCSATGGTQLFIKNLAGHITNLSDLNPDDTVETIKKKIQSKKGIPLKGQVLIYGGQRLENGRKISDYNIKDKDIIHIVLTL